MNILFLGGAKRVSIGRMFIEAGKRLGQEVALFSYELERKVPIASIAEVIVGKRWRDNDVIADLKNVCIEKGIDVVIPFVDGAIEIASLLVDELKRSGKSVFAPVSDANVCRMMFDKIASDEAFRNAGLLVPEGLQYPMIAKPRFGSASKGIIVIRDADDLGKIENLNDYLLQEYITDFEEYTVDCYVGRAGEPLVISPRIRLEVVGGEVMRTRTIDSPELVALTRKAIEWLSLRGAITVQFLKDLRDGRLMIMEVNPRLGGGVVCSIHAGGDIPTLILREAMSELQGDSSQLSPMAATPDVEIARYPQEVVF